MSNTINIADRFERNVRLPDQVREQAVLPLADAFAEALAPLEAALLDRAKRGDALQRAFLDAARDLRGRREDIVTRFRGQLQRSWDALREGRPLSIEDILARSVDDPLSLVSDQELESRLAVTDLAAAIRRECKAALTQLDRRVGRVLGNPRLGSAHNPVGADHVAAAVYRSFMVCDFAPEVRLELLRLCEAAFLPHVARVYESLNEWMVQAGVKPESPAARPAPAPSKAEAAPKGDEDAEDAIDAAPQWAARFLSRIAGIRQPGGAAAQSAMPGFGNLAPARLPGFGDVMQDYGNTPSVQGVLLEALHYLLQQSRQTRGVPDVFAEVPGQQQRDLSQREMLSVLSLLQASPSATLRAAIGDSGESLAQRLKHEVFSGAMQLGVDPSTVRLAPGDEDVIDLVGMLFDVLLDERDLAGRSRELIGRLLVPFVKVAMLDRRMFVQKTHPARRLLNALAEACEGNDGERPAARTLLTKVEEVVQRLLAEFNESVAIFLTLEEEFSAYLDQYRRGIEIAERRAAEAQRGQERLEAARSRTQIELKRRLYDEDLPQAIKDFLYQPWAHHVTLAVLRTGEEGEDLRDALSVADGLLDELADARRHVVDKAWLQDWRPDLLKVFASMGMNADAAGNAVDALRDTLKAVAEVRPELEKSLPELPQVALAKPAPAENVSPLQLVAGTDTLEFDPSEADYFRNLAIGTWLDFIDKDNKVQPCKLSWVSPISSRLLFVNRRGVNACVASPEELAAMVRLGRLRAHQSEGAFDSAMQGVIERLEPVAA